MKNSDKRLFITESYWPLVEAERNSRKGWFIDNKLLWSNGKKESEMPEKPCERFELLKSEPR